MDFCNWFLETLAGLGEILYLLRMFLRLLPLALVVFALNLSAVNVTKFGADGSDQADDSKAVQAAVDTASGIIELPPGRYRFEKTVEIDLSKVGQTSIQGSSGVIIEMAAAGPAFRIKGTHKGTASPATVEPGVWDRERMPTVDGFGITGSHPEACGIEVTETMGIILSRLHIRKVKHGIHLPVRNRNVIINSCHIYENSGVGIFLDAINLHQINIGDTHVSYNDQGGIVARGGDVRNIHIGNCDIEGNHSEDTDPTANVLIDCADGSVGEIAITGCTIQHTHNAPGSANIRILCGSDLRAKEREVDRHRDGNITITGNVLSDVQVNIHLKEARGVTISGNTMWKGYERNLILEQCSQVVVSGNVQDRSPRYNYGDGRDTRNGVLIKDCEAIVLQGELIQGSIGHEAGLVLQDCKEVNVTGCILKDNEGAGVLLDGCEMVRVSDSIITHGSVTDYQPIRIKGGKLIKISDNLTN